MSSSSLSSDVALVPVAEAGSVSTAPAEVPQPAPAQAQPPKEPPMGFVGEVRMASTRAEFEKTHVVMKRYQTACMLLKSKLKKQFERNLLALEDAKAVEMLVPCVLAQFTFDKNKKAWKKKMDSEAMVFGAAFAKVFGTDYNYVEQQHERCPGWECLTIIAWRIYWVGDDWPLPSALGIAGCIRPLSDREAYLKVVRGNERQAYYVKRDKDELDGAVEYMIERLIHDGGQMRKGKYVAPWCPVTCQNGDTAEMKKRRVERSLVFGSAFALSLGADYGFCESMNSSNTTNFVVWKTFWVEDAIFENVKLSIRAVYQRRDTTPNGETTQPSLIDSSSSSSSSTQSR